MRIEKKQHILIYIFILHLSYFLVILSLYELHVSLWLWNIGVGYVFCLTSFIFVFNSTPGVIDPRYILSRAADYTNGHLHQEESNSISIQSQIDDNFEENDKNKMKLENSIDSNDSDGGDDNDNDDDASNNSDGRGALNKREKKSFPFKKEMKNRKISMKVELSSATGLIGGSYNDNANEGDNGDDDDDTEGNNADAKGLNEFKFNQERDNGLIDDGKDHITDPEKEGLLGQTMVTLSLEPDEDLDERLSGVPKRLIPARAKYCRATKKIVGTFDHHCGFLGTTIGEQNHGRFVLFLLVHTSAIVHAFSHVFLEFEDTNAHPISWLEQNGFILFVVIYLCILMILIGGLFAFHVFLVCANLTTYEFLRTDKISYLKGTRDFDLPYSNGLRNNLKFVIFSDPLCYRIGYGIGMTPFRWQPKVWKLPEKIERDSDDVCENLWENRYWSCC